MLYSHNISNMTQFFHVLYEKKSFTIPPSKASFLSVSAPAASTQIRHFFVNTHQSPRLGFKKTLCGETFLQLDLCTDRDLQHFLFFLLKNAAELRPRKREEEVAGIIQRTA